jgi:hypothetical protein
MSRRDVRTTRGMRMSTVVCDRKDCNETFRSASDPKMIDAQLAAAGWILIEIENKHSLAWDRKTLCPAHRPTKGGAINGLHWRERAAKGAAGSVSGHQRYSGDLR